jgi:solute:Na+ symporter, SSS family
MRRERYFSAGFLSWRNLRYFCLLVLSWLATTIRRADFPVNLIKSLHISLYFIVHHFPRNTGIAGLMLAAILAAALSSSLNASASALINDFYVGSRKTPASVDHLLRLTRHWTIGFGIVQIVIAIFARGLAQTVVNNALAIAGFTFGLLLGVFALGMWTRRTGQSAAVAGMTAGLIVLLFIKFHLNGSQVVIAHTWFALIGSVTTFSVGYAASWILPRKEVSV